MGSHFFKLIWVLGVLPFIVPFLMKVNSQTQGCFPVALDLQHCLNPSSNNPSSSLDSCCMTINQAIQAGYNCLCSLLSPSNYPLFSMTLSLSFSSCYISIPPRNHCQDPYPVLPPPFAAVPMLHQPPPSDPVKDDFVPLPPKVKEISSTSLKRNDSSMVESKPVESSNPLPKLGIPEFWEQSTSRKKLWHSRMFLMAALCAYIA